jgi:hypothetical protein
VTALCVLSRVRWRCCRDSSHVDDYTLERSLVRSAACVAAVKAIEGLESTKCAWASSGVELGGPWPAAETRAGDGDAAARGDNWYSAQEAVGRRESTAQREQRNGGVVGGRECIVS